MHTTWIFYNITLNITFLIFQSVLKKIMPFLRCCPIGQHKKHEESKHLPHIYQKQNSDIDQESVPL